MLPDRRAAAADLLPQPLPLIFPRIKSSIEKRSLGNQGGISEHFLSHISNLNKMPVVTVGNTSESNRKSHHHSDPESVIRSTRNASVNSKLLGHCLTSWCVASKNCKKIGERSVGAAAVPKRWEKAKPKPPNSLRTRVANPSLERKRGSSSSWIAVKDCEQISRACRRMIGQQSTYLHQCGELCRSIATRGALHEQRALRLARQP